MKEQQFYHKDECTENQVKIILNMLGMVQKLKKIDKILEQSAQLTEAQKCQYNKTDSLHQMRFQI
jgi:hypothetical protein